MPAATASTRSPGQSPPRAEAPSPPRLWRSSRARSVTGQGSRRRLHIEMEVPEHQAPGIESDLVQLHPSPSCATHRSRPAASRNRQTAGCRVWSAASSCRFPTGRALVPRSTLGARACGLPKRRELAALHGVRPGKVRTDPPDNQEALLSLGPSLIFPHTYPPPFGR